MDKARKRKTPQKITSINASIITFLVLVFASLSAASFAILFDKSREMLGSLFYLENICNTDWKFPCLRVGRLCNAVQYLQDYWAVMAIFFVVFVIFAILAYFVLKDFDIGGQKEELQEIKKSINKTNKSIENLSNMIAKAIKKSDKNK